MDAVTNHAPELLLSKSSGGSVGSNVNNVQGDGNRVVQGDKTMSENRNINTGGGNYNENIQGDYIQGNSNKDVNQSRSFQVGDVGGDFNPINSPIISDNVENSGNVNKSKEQEKPSNKKLSRETIIALLGILIALISIFASGLFNTEIRRIFHLDPPSKTQPVQEKKSN